MAVHNDLGHKAEQLAAAYLESKGYITLEKNWTSNRAELDLIVAKDQKIIFVEVKGRSSEAFGLPEEFVDKRKQQQMEQASAAYIEQVMHEGEVRFDIIAITFKQDRSYTLKHIEDAFWPEN